MQSKIIATPAIIFTNVLILSQNIRPIVNTTRKIAPNIIFIYSFKLLTISLKMYVNPLTNGVNKKFNTSKTINAPAI